MIVGAVIEVFLTSVSNEKDERKYCESNLVAMYTLFFGLVSMEYSKGK